MMTGKRRLLCSGETATTYIAADEDGSDDHLNEGDEGSEAEDARPCPLQYGSERSHKQHQRRSFAKRHRRTRLTFVTLTMAV